MAIDSGTLKLYRSETIYDTHEQALSALTSLTLSDGQPAISRYYTSVEKDEIRAILAIENADASGTSSKTIFDIEDTNEAIEEVQNKIKNNKYVKRVYDKAEIENDKAADVDKYTVVHDGDTDTESEFQVVYHPVSPLTSKMPKAVGDIAKDTTAGDLAGRPISQILDDILFETIYPSITQPSVTFAITGFGSGSVYNVGANLPTTTVYSPTPNRGSAKITETGYNVSYAGAPTETTYSGTGHALVNGGTTKFPSPGAYTWIATVTFGDGEDILDSKGKKATKFASGTYKNPYTSTSVNSGTVTLNASYPYFTNGAHTATNTGEVAAPSYELVDDATYSTLQNWTTSTFYVSFNSEAASGNRYIFDVPTGKRLTKAEFYTKVGGWQALSMDDGDATTHQVEGVSVDYTRYKCNTAVKNGALNVRFTVA